MYTYHEIYERLLYTLPEIINSEESLMPDE